MARIKGVDIPNNKRIEIALTYIYGIGRSLSNKILEVLQKMTEESDIELNCGCRTEVGVHAFALADDGFTAHVRNFAPLYDIPEESATGTANAALTYYLYKQGIIAPDTSCSFMQGETMQRPSVVETEIKEGSKVYVGGNSYILTKGEIYL